MPTTGYLPSRRAGTPSTRAATSRRLETTFQATWLVSMRAATCSERSEAMKALLRARRAGIHPLLELGDKIVVGNGYRFAAKAWIPAPKHELVVADVLDKGREVLAAVGLSIFDRPAKVAAGEPDENHFPLRRRQMPV